MNIGELKEAIKDIPDDMQVRLITDHGQVPMLLNGGRWGWIEEDSYMPDEVDESNLEGYEMKVFILGAF